MRINKQILTTIILFSLCLNITGQSKQLTDWDFYKGTVGGTWDIWRGNFQLKWQKVKVPHTFNAEDTVDPDVSYYQGQAWYKNTLEIDNPHKNGRTLLNFGASGHKTTVYIYDQKIATHIGGYNQLEIIFKNNHLS